jgi:hypothetical protein
MCVSRLSVTTKLHWWGRGPNKPLLSVYKLDDNSKNIKKIYYLLSFNSLVLHLIFSVLAFKIFLSSFVASIQIRFVVFAGHTIFYSCLARVVWGWRCMDTIRYLRGKLGNRWLYVPSNLQEHIVIYSPSFPVTICSIHISFSYDLYPTTNRECVPQKPHIRFEYP